MLPTRSQLLCFVLTSLVDPSDHLLLVLGKCLLQLPEDLYCGLYYKSMNKMLKMYYLSPILGYG